MQMPADYAARYEKLSVPSLDGGSDLATGLHVDSYLLGVRNGGYDERVRVGQKIEKDLAIRRKADKSAKIAVRVNTPTGVQTREFDNLNHKDADDQLWKLLSYPFVGKGSPEGIQALLQLAAVDLPGSPPVVKPANFQSYCDKWLGLDCNGLVGNYLRHQYQNIDWWDVSTTANKISPNNLITDIWNGLDGTVRNAADDVDFNDLNLLVMVDKAGKTIPGGSAGPGHIMISQPREVDFQVGLKKTLGVADDETLPGIIILESTAAKDEADSKNGVAKSVYAYVDYKPQKGVMTVRRGLNGTTLNVRIKGAKWNG